MHHINKYITIQSTVWHLYKHQTTTLLVYLHISHINSTLIYLFSRHVALEFNNSLNYIISLYQHIKDNHICTCHETYHALTVSSQAYIIHFIISIFYASSFPYILCIFIPVIVYIKLNINYILCTYSYFVYLSS